LQHLTIFKEKKRILSPFPFSYISTGNTNSEGALMLFLKLFLLTWFVAGVGTAIGGLAWTCWKSSQMLKDSPAPSRAFGD
jgi:hypothetical protein